MTPEVRKGIRKYRKHLRKASTARISDEMLNLLKSGAAEQAFRQLHATGLLEVILPDLHRALEKSSDHELFAQLALIDRWVDRGRNVSDTVLYGTLTMAPMAEAARVAEERKGGRLAKGEYLALVEELLKGTPGLVRIPARRQHQLKQAYLGAYKMRRRPSGQRGSQSMVGRGYFRDALDLFTLEVEGTGRYRDVLQEWQQLKKGDRGGRDRQGEQRGRRGASRGDRGKGERRDTRGRDDRRRKPKSESPGRDEERSRTQRESERRSDDRQPPGRDRQARDRERTVRKDPGRPRDARPAQETVSTPVEPEPTAPPPAAAEPAASPIETVPTEEYEHGRSRRETRSWDGVAGQQSPVIQEMKERLDKGEMNAHLDDETPWYVPGQPVNGMEPEPEEAGGEEEQEKPDREKDPEAGKWGRTRREGPPRL